MNAPVQERRSSGQPTGGEFAPRSRTADTIVLAVPDNVLQERASAPDATAEDLIEVAEGDNWLASTWVAAHPNADEVALDIIAHQDDRGAKRNVARHPALGNETIDFLLDTEGEDIRVLIAGRPGLPEKYQQRHLGDPSIHVLSELSRRKDLTPDIRKILSESDHPIVAENAQR